MREAAVDFVLGRAQAVVPDGFDGDELASVLSFGKYEARLVQP